MNDWTLFESAFMILVLFGIPTALGVLWYMLKALWEGIKFIGGYIAAAYGCMVWRREEKRRKEQLRRWGIIN